jgi:hypothetical protein
VWIKITKIRRQDGNGPYATALHPRANLTPEQWDARMGDTYRQNFASELRRMNLLRRCRLYCVGIGEAAPAWLNLVAMIGGTEAVYFGPDSPEPAPLPDRPDPRRGD